MKEKISRLHTEKSNPKSERLDTQSTIAILQLINREDQTPAKAVSKNLPTLAQLIEEIARRLKNGGRLFYAGAGTSGRLGILDASECPPTFGTDPELVQGIIAGGMSAVFKAVEGAEDHEDDGRQILKQKKCSAKDCVIGLSASGRTPFVIGALKFAREIHALTAGITCNPQAKMFLWCDFPIAADVGPEIIAGSTRLKCGTAQKMILNMISTGVMVRLGLVSGNRMVNLIPKSEKLWERAKALVMKSLDVSEKKAEVLLKQAEGNARRAIELGEI